MRLLTLVTLALCACLAPLVAPAGTLANVELYDRTDGTTLPVYRHRGRLYVAGEPRHQYEIRIRSDSGQRILAVTSVDGVNVVTGETAAEQQGGYVLDPYGAIEIDGWRKSLHDVATFYFTSLGDSYAARTGRPNDVGVIGVALFREKTRCCEHFFNRERDSAKSEAPAAAPELERRASRPDAQADAQLGTGHGHREQSSARYVDFERASSIPDETIVIYYNSMRNLIAQGVIPKARNHGKHGPRPFPNGFVPDP
jgi:hypothetical protein